MDEKAKELFQKNWGDTSMVYAEELYDLGSLDYIEEYHKSTFSGIITFFEKDHSIHIVSLDTVISGKGIGTSLLNSLTELAVKRHKSAIYVETTNDNCDAIRFYQTHGFDIYDLQLNEVDIQRKLKPSIPLIGCCNIPIKHIIKFVKYLN